MSETPPTAVVDPPEGVAVVPLTPEEQAEELRKQLQVQIVDISEGVEAHARDAAAEYIDRATTEGGFLKRFVKKIWYGNVARDFVYLRHKQKGVQTIAADENLYALQGGSAEDHRRASEAVVTRFVNGYLHEGESQRSMADVGRAYDLERNPEGAGAELENQLKQLVSKYASGEIANLRVLEEAKKRILSEYGTVLRAEGSKDARRKGLLFADNVLEVAKNAKAAFDHGAGLARLQETLGVRHGEARVGVRSDVKLNAVERAADKLTNIKGLSGLALLNETAAGFVAAVVITAGKFTLRKASTAVGLAAGMGVGAAVVAGVRENLHIKQDRRTHMRSMAEGGGDSLIHTGKRREALERVRYETVAARELIDQLGAGSAEAGNGVEGLRRAMEAVAHTRARIEMSDRANADFIHFSGKTRVEQERLELDTKLAEARVAVQQAIQEADDGVLSAAGIAGRDASGAIDRATWAITEQLQGDVRVRDIAFQKLRAKSVAKMAAVGFVTGEVFGMATQEIKAAVSDGLQGVFDHPDEGDRRTLLASLLRGDSTTTTTVGTHDIPPVEGTHLVTIDKNTQVNIPNGFNLSEHDGNWQLSDAAGKVLDAQVSFDDNGQLSAATQADLAKLGFRDFGHTVDVVHDPNTQTEHYKTVADKDTITYTQESKTPADYIAAHKNQFTAVSRDLWYDNGTPGTPDHNEMDLWWGGVNNTGVDAQGNYVFDIAHMTQDGSWAQGASANVQQLIHEGKMAIALSITDGTQSHVVMVPINEQGQAVISKDSFMAKGMFKTGPDGRARFIGAYAEAVQLGEVKGGVQSVNMLATVVGENKVTTLSDRVPHVQHHSHQEMYHETIHHQHNVVTDTFQAPHTTEVVTTTATTEFPVEVMPVVPLYGRRGLERSGREAMLRNPNLAPFYYGGRSLEEMRAWIAADPSRLYPRHEVTNPDGTKVWLEADGTPVARSVERERSLIKAYLDKQKQSNAEHYRMVERTASALAPMSRELRVSVNVPAWMEADNLRHFLEEYTSQVDKEGAPLSPDLYEINILVNRKTGTPADGSVAVIEKFIADFEATHGFKPSVNYCDVELDPPYNNVGYARKLLTDAAVMRSVNRPEQDASLYIETEDADLINVDKKTVTNLIEKMDKNPQLDAVRGVQDRTPEYMMQNDLLFLRLRAGNFFEIMARKKDYRDPTKPNWNYTWNRVVTGGWNTGYSAEAYALMEGYDTVEQGEDMSVGEKLTMIRGNGNLPNLEVIGTVASRTDSSPRRFIHEVATDKGAYEGGNFADEEINDSIRDNSLEDALASISRYSRINDENKEAFNGAVQYIALNAARSITPSPQEADHVARRILFWLGFRKEDYELVGDRLTIKTWDNVKATLENYRTRYGARLAASS